MKKGEVQFSCPICRHPNFYFNTVKGLGFCHRCQWAPNRRKLEEKLGRAFIWADPESDPKSAPLSLPPGASPLLEERTPDWITPHCELCEEAVQHIEEERGVSRQKQYLFRIHASENRLFVPVYEQHELVSYVGRAKWWIYQDVPRYQYPIGTSISNYIFCWDDFRRRSELTLVENTFNALWLRELGTTTNFGSHLSGAQMNRIYDSRVRSVLLLWDEGAESRAEVACEALRARGIFSTFVRLTGQPDGHSAECLASLIRSGHDALKLPEKRKQPIDVGHRPCLR